jgi:hypothetical protein
MSSLQRVIALCPGLKSGDGQILTDPFLDVCSEVLPFIGAFVPLSRQEEALLFTALRIVAKQSLLCAPNAAFSTLLLQCREVWGSILPCPKGRAR